MERERDCHVDEKAVIMNVTYNCRLEVIGKKLSVRQIGPVWVRTSTACWIILKALNYYNHLPHSSEQNTIRVITTRAAKMHDGWITVQTRTRDSRWFTPAVYYYCGFSLKWVRFWFILIYPTISCDVKLWFTCTVLSGLYMICSPKPNRFEVISIQNQFFQTTTKISNIKSIYATKTAVQHVLPS